MSNNNQQRGRNARLNQPRLRDTFQERLDLNRGHKSSGTQRGRGNSATIRANGGGQSGPNGR